MKLEKPDDDEFEMLLEEIPHATSHHQQQQHHHHHHHHDHQQQQQQQQQQQHHQHEHNHHVHVLNGHGHSGHAHHGHGHVSSPKTIPGLYDDDSISCHGHVHDGHAHSGHAYNVHGHGYGSSPAQAIHGMYDDDPSSCHGYVCVSPVSGVSLRSEVSSSSSLSGRLSPDDGGSPPPPTIKYQTPLRKTQYPNGFWPSRESETPDYSAGKNVNTSFTDELGLSDKLWKMCIRDGVEDASRFERLAPLGNTTDLYGMQFNDFPSGGAEHGNVVMKSPFEDCRNGFSNDYGRLQALGVPNSPVFDEEMRRSMLGLQQQQQQQQQHRMGNLSGSCLPSQWPDVPLFPGQYMDPMNYPWKQPKEHPSIEALNNLQAHSAAAFGRNCYDREIHVPNAVPSINRPSIADVFFRSQRNGIDSSGDWGRLDSLSSPYAPLPKLASGVGNPLHYNSPMFNDRAGWFPNDRAPQSHPSMRSMPELEAFTCEGNLIIQGKDFNYRINDRRDLSREYQSWQHDDIGRARSIDKNSELDGRTRSTGIPSGNSEIGRSPRPPILPPKYNSLMEVRGYIYLIAKDQHGCRFLQRKFDEGTPQDVQMIFNEIIDNVVELMMNPFGNYLMQKLLDVCTEEQRLQILLVVTAEPGELVRISLNTHGTRAVQKLIETLKTRQQISLVISALEPGFLDLIKDLNGNHVVQRCLQCLSAEDNKFIFDAAAKYCVDIATHRHGCCVLQRCIAHSTGVHRENLVAEISANGLLLAQDPFGNYVVQYILELKIPLAIANLASQFEGNYAHLSTQKFSSNVVEKCLKFFGEESRSRIIHELLSTSRFEQLLQDPFANYVIQSALVISKGPLHASLVEVIRPHAAILRTSPYCKRIFSRALLKK